MSSDCDAIVLTNQHLASGPVDIPGCTVALDNPIYHFGEAVTKLIIKDLFDAIGAQAYILRQQVKLVLQ